MNARSAVGHLLLALLISNMASIFLLFAAVRLKASPQGTFPVASYTPSALPSSTPLPTFTALPTFTPSPTATLIVEIPPGSQTYTIQPGDTLAAIAAHYGVSINAIMEANNLTDSNRLSIGQLLIIPIMPTAAPSATITAAHALQPTQTPLDAGLSFVIRAGESRRAELTSGQTDRWTLNIGSERHIAINIAADRFGHPDPYVEVYDPSGRLIAADDDSGGNLNAQIASLPVRANNQYTIVVSSRNNTVGTYVLSVERID